MKPSRSILTFSLPFMLVGCVSNPVQKAYTSMESHLAGCVQQTRYDPDKEGRMISSGLHNNEKAYLSCAYEGIESILMSKSRLPELYQDLISQHKFMTMQVDTGQMDRATRKNKTQALIDEIKKQEKLDVEKLQQELDQALEEYLKEEREERELREMVR